MEQEQLDILKAVYELGKFDVETQLLQKLGETLSHEFRFDYAIKIFRKICNELGYTCCQTVSDVVKVFKFDKATRTDIKIMEVKF